MARSKQTSTPFPTREQLLAFIKDHAGQGRHARDCARFRTEECRSRRTEAGAARSCRRRRRSRSAARSCISRAPCPRSRLPTSLERDRDGELIAVPDRMGRRGARRGTAHPAFATPRKAEARRRRGHRRPRAAPGREASRAGRGRATYSGRVIKILDRAKKRMLGIFRALAGRRRTAHPGRQEVARPRTCDCARRHHGCARTANWSPPTSPRKAASACRPAASRNGSAR